MEPTFENLQKIFRNIFQDESLLIQSSTAAKDVKGWDSFTHMLLIAEIEDRFNVRFTYEEVASFNDVGEILTLISNKKNGI